MEETINSHLNQLDDCPLNFLFEFKGNIPSVCDIRIGESYDAYYDVISAVQDKRTGDMMVDFYLEEYSASVDINSAQGDSISEIELRYYPYEPFTPVEMEKVAKFFWRHFDFTGRKSCIIEEGDEYSYDYECYNEKYTITIHKDSHNPQLIITLSANVERVGELQGANIYYYHTPLGVYGVKDSVLGLSNTRHPGTLSREDVIENMMAAMKRSNELGEDWHFDYAYSFLHQSGTILPLDDEKLLEDEGYMREHAEEMTNEYDYLGGRAHEILRQAGVGEPLFPIEEIYKEELLDGSITDLKDHFEELCGEWTLGQVLPYESLDY